MHIGTFKERVKRKPSKRMGWTGADSPFRTIPPLELDPPQKGKRPPPAKSSQPAIWAFEGGAPHELWISMAHE